MSIADTIKGLILKRPATSELRDPRCSKEALAGGRRAGEAENPYLAARRTWNEHVGAVVSQRQTWQVIGILSLLIALAGVGGMIHIGSKSKFIPYAIEVDRLGRAQAIGPVQTASGVSQRSLEAAVSDWVSCARTVTPDVAMQRKCVFKVYAMLAPTDPATPKMNEWLNGTPESSPFKRAEKEMVDIEIKTALPQTPSTLQVEWVETSRDRQGTLKGPPVTMRALVTTYVAEVTPSTTEEQMRMNPQSIFVRDYSWSRVQ